jgi:hypothetical protein
MMSRPAQSIGLALLLLMSTTPARGAGIEVNAAAASEGPHGLQVNFGPDCASPQDLVLDGDDGPLQGTYEACRTVSVESIGVTGGSVTLRAGDEISLGQGFTVSSGASFVAENDPALTGGDTYVQDTSPIAETVYTARFSARLDDLVLASGEKIDSLVAYSGGWQVIFRLSIEPASGGGYQLVLEARQDGGGMVQTPPGEEIPVPAGWTTVELAWAAGAGDGQLLVGLNGGALAGLADLDNGASLIETIRLGAVEGAIFTSSGAIQLDTYSSTR